jgi:Ca2+-binding RTX toxin-like protein
MSLINGTENDDVLTGTSGDDTIEGQGGADAISGEAGADTISGGSGEDLVAGGVGRDTIDLGSGDDTWLVTNEDVVLNVAYGDWGASSIFDSADGGDGYDKLWLMSSSSGVNLDVSKAAISGFESLWLIGSGYSDGRKARLTDTQLSSFSDIDARRTNLSEGSFEPFYYNNNLDFFNFPDKSSYTTSRPIGGIIYLTDGSGDELIELDARIFDSFFVSSVIFEGQTEFINGDGHIFAKASIFDDILTGGAGIDVFRGGGGDDQLSGKEGNDVLRGEDGDDIIFGGADNDWLEGQAGDDTLYGGDGDDQLFGGAGKNVLYGEVGSDTLTLEQGAEDEAFGGAGDDTFTIAIDGSGKIDGGSGVDRILVTQSTDITGYTINNIERIELDAVAKLYLTPDQAANIQIIENETLVSSEVWLKMTEPGSFTLNQDYYDLSQRLLGSDGDDLISGSSHADILSGGGGSDIIDASAGDDTIIISYSDWDGKDRQQSFFTDEFGASVYTSRLIKVDNIDGGVGNDTLKFYDDNHVYSAGIHFDSSIQGIENLSIESPLSQAVFDASLWRTLDQISIEGNDNLSLYLAGDGGVVNLNNLSEATDFNKATV